RVEIAGEVQIEFVHRHDLGIASPGGATLHPKAGAEARLAQAYCGFLAFAIKRVTETNGRRGLSLARRRGIDGGDEDEFSVRLVGEATFDEIHPDLRFVMPERLDAGGGNAEFAGDLQNWQKLRLLGNFPVGSWRAVC